MPMISDQEYEDYKRFRSGGSAAATAPMNTGDVNSNELARLDSSVQAMRQPATNDAGRMQEFQRLGTQPTQGNQMQAAQPVAQRAAAPMGWTRNAAGETVWGQAQAGTPGQAQPTNEDFVRFNPSTGRPEAKGMQAEDAGFEYNQAENAWRKRGQQGPQNVASPPRDTSIAGTADQAPKQAGAWAFDQGAGRWRQQG